LGDKCNACPAPAENNAIAVAGVGVGIGGLFVYVLITLSDVGKIDPADGAKSIGLSYIQIISLLTTFPIAWPDIFVNIFRIGGAVGKLIIVVRLLCLCSVFSNFFNLSLFQSFSLFHSCHGATFSQFKMHVPQPIRSRRLFFHPNHMGPVATVNTILCDFDLVGHLSLQTNRAIAFENESNGGCIVVFNVAGVVQ
jgi:hypothetical protein